ncbi:MAG: ABC transporter ATP-binding protein [Pseudomonadota bacterium]
MTQAVYLENIQFSWSKHAQPLLDIAELSIAPGEKIFIQGRSGSGKTTLLGLLGGVLLPQQGSVQLLGQTVSSLSSARRDAFRATHIGFVFQLFNLLPYLSVIDNVLLPCRFSKTRKIQAIQQTGSLSQAATDLLEALELPADFLQKPVAELSVGQQQRVAFARALIGAPPILITDEPTSALDIDTQSGLLQLLFRECSNNQTTLIFVSHDQRLAAHFDRVIQMDKLTKTD